MRFPSLDPWGRSFPSAGRQLQLPANYVWITYHGASLVNETETLKNLIKCDDDLTTI